MTTLRPSVRAVHAAFARRFEGDISWPYHDVRGLITVGLGCLIDPIERALPLPWVDAASRQPVAPAIVRREWGYLKRRRDLVGATAARQRTATSLRLTPEAIDRLALDRLAGVERGLLSRWPDLAVYPAAVQLCLVSMAWALGTGGLIAGFPRFGRAVDAQDWTAAAGECAIKTTGNAGVAPRNVANKALLLFAAGGGASDALPAPWG